MKKGMNLFWILYHVFLSLASPSFDIQADRRTDSQLHKNEYGRKYSRTDGRKTDEKRERRTDGRTDGERWLVVVLIFVTDFAPSGVSDVGVTPVEIAAADIAVSDVSDVDVADIGVDDNENPDLETAHIAFLYRKKKKNRASNVFLMNFLS